MPAIQQIALAVAVVVPVAVIVGLNVYLFFMGESGTLLVPGRDRYPAIALDAEPAPETAAEPGVAIAEEELPPLRKAA